MSASILRGNESLDRTLARAANTLRSIRYAGSQQAQMDWLLNLQGMVESAIREAINQLPPIEAAYGNAALYNLVSCDIEQIDFRSESMCADCGCNLGDNCDCHNEVDEDTEENYRVPCSDISPINTIWRAEGQIPDDEDAGKMLYVIEDGKYYRPPDHIEWD